MVQSFIQPKGTLKPQTNIEDLQKQYAQLISKPQTQEQQETDTLRQTVNDLVKKSLLNPVEIPKYTTLGDVLGAEKGSKLNAFADFLNNPQTMRTIGNFLPKYGYDPKTGQINNVMETPARREEAKFEADRQKALEELKQQNALANSIYGAYQQMDIANLNDKRMRELAEQEQKWRTEEAEKDREFRRQERAADRANQLTLSRIIHGGGGGSSSGGSSGGGGGTVTGGAAGVNLNNIKMTAAERKSLTENKTTLANIESGLKALDANPNAYSFVKGILGSDITNRLDPKGVATRTQIDNITAVYRKWLTGAQMSDKERKAYERFLPAPTDNYTIVKSKLEGMRGAVQRANDAILSNYGISATNNADPMGLGL